MKNSRFIILFVLILITGLIAFLIYHQKSKKEEIDVYNWPYYLDQEIISKFEKKYDCKVNYKEFPSNEDLLNDLEGSTTKWDVIFPSDYMVEVMIKKNLLIKLDKSKLFNFKNLNNSFLQKNYDKANDFSIPFSWGVTGIGYNKTKITNITSFNSLFDEKNKAKIALLDDVRFTIGMALIRKGYSINTRDDKILDEVLNDLLSQKKIIKAYNSENYVDLLKNGEVDLLYGYSPDIIQSIPDNPNLEFVIPQEGGILYIDNMCIPIKSDNRIFAYKFMDFLLEKENAAYLVNNKWLGIPNKSAEPMIKSEIRNNKSVYPPDSVIAKCQMIMDLGDGIKKYEDIWKRVKQ